MIAIFEGPEVLKFFVPKPGQVKRVPTGRVNVLRFDVRERKKTSLVVDARVVRSVAESLGAKFFPRGAWENPQMPPPFGKLFHGIKPEIYNALIGGAA